MSSSSCRKRSSSSRSVSHRMVSRWCRVFTFRTRSKLPVLTCRARGWMAAGRPVRCMRAAWLAAGSGACPHTHHPTTYAFCEGVQCRQRYRLQLLHLHRERGRAEAATTGPTGELLLCLACRLKVQGPPTLHSGISLGAVLLHPRCMGQLSQPVALQTTITPITTNQSPPQRTCIPAAFTTSFSAASSATSSKGSCCESCGCMLPAGGGKNGRPATGCAGSKTSVDLGAHNWLIDVKSQPSQPAAPSQAGLDSAPAEPRSLLLTGVVIFKVGSAPGMRSSLAADADRARVRRLLPHPLVDALFQHIHKPVAARGGNGERQVGGAWARAGAGAGRHSLHQEATGSRSVEQRERSAHLSGLCS